MKPKLDINVQTRVGDMLDSYPQLEGVLLELSPSFSKLKNPVLRRTVARVVSLKQVAEIGGVDIGQMISVLRKAAGLGMEDESVSGNEGIPDEEQPGWFDLNRIVATFNASPVIEKGDSPMKSILQISGELHSGQILKLITPFKPAPIIELLESKKYKCWSSREDKDTIFTYIYKA